MKSKAWFLLVAAVLFVSIGEFATSIVRSQEEQLVPSGKYSSDSFECRNGVVVSASTLASRAGQAILQQDGNAVDASVATAFALAVTYPAAGNIGGGGFMLVYPEPARGKPVVFDYRETAPAAAWPTMFSKEDSQYKHKSVAVPGTVRGMAKAHEHFGSLDWSLLLQPAIELAKGGFAIDPYLADLLNDVLASATDAVELQRVFAQPDGRRWQAGDRLIQPDLAKTLQLIADQGADVFYLGAIAKEIVSEMRRGDGIITSDDLSSYQTVERRPLSTTYRNEYEVFVPPPPSSGGTCLLEELNILQTFDLKQMDRWSPELFHVMAECMRRASYDRARYIGDPAFVDIPSKLTTRFYGEELAKTIDLLKATRSLDIAADIPVDQEGENTTHFSVIDKNGMAVANTYTLERIWGSRIVVKGMGFLLNNDMRAFNIFPGVTDTKGGLGTAPNCIEPGKRPISSQMPTIVAKDGKVLLVTGSPGSQAIPNTILGILVSTLDYGLPLRDAVDAPRFSQSWMPDQIIFEAPERYPALTSALKRLGHNVIRSGPLPQGDAHSIWVTEKGLRIGVADRRRNNRATALGY